MSILLEALRKSEKSQRPVAPPTIHADHQVNTVSEPLRKGPVALLLLVALLLIAWLVWRQYQAPTEGHQPPVTLSAQKKGAITTPVSSLQPADASVGPGKAVKRVSNQQRTPVENYRQAGSNKSQPNTSGQKPVADVQAPQPADTAVNSAKAVAAQKPGSRNGIANMIPTPISYWELPSSVRENVPEISFSVLVYANQPVDRFVLIDGQRLQEGDSYQDGLVVEKIQRDGVVFSYRLYRFLVER